SSTGVVQAVTPGSATIYGSVNDESGNVVYGSTGITIGAATTPSVSQLAVSVQPVGGQSGSALATQPVIQVRTASNQVVSSSTASVTASIASGSGTLSGTTTVNAVNGVA